MPIISVKINVDKIDRSRFFQGKKGRYLNLVLIETPDSEYGDYMVKQEQSREERDRGEKTPIVGNAKVLRSKGGGGNGPSPRPASSEEETDW